MTAGVFRTAPLVLLILGTFYTTKVGAQERRRSPDGAGAPPVGAATHPRAPFAGAWHGSRRMNDGPGNHEPVPYAMVIESDSAGRRYAGYVVLPNGRRAPVERLSEAAGALSWHQPNNGGGTWVYTARLVGRETLEGTVVLRDWPQGSGTAPSGTFTLARRPPA